MNALAAELALASTSCLTVAAILAWGLRRRSAAFRAQLWLVGFLAMAAWMLVRVMAPSLAIHVPLLPSKALISKEMGNEVQSAPDTSDRPILSVPDAPRESKPQPVSSGRQFSQDRRAEHVERPDPGAPSEAQNSTPSHSNAETHQDEFHSSNNASEPSHTTLEVLSEWLTGLSWPTALNTVWLLGTLFLTIRVLLGTIALQWFLRSGRRVRSGGPLEKAMNEAVPANARNRIRLAVHPQIQSPISFGVGTCWILFPVEADHSWNESRIALVASHEIAHCLRQDYLSILVLRLIVAACWFNPLAWWGYERFRLLCEMAADDHALLSIGKSKTLSTWIAPDQEAITYAAELVALTRALRPLPSTLGAGTLSIGGADSLRCRISALLDSQMDRRTPGVRKAWAMAFLAITAAILIPTVRIVEREAAAHLSPVVTPASPYLEEGLTPGLSRKMVLTLLNENGDSLTDATVRVIAPHLFLYLKTGSDGKVTISLPEKIEDSLVIDISSSGYVSRQLLWTMKNPDDTLPGVFEFHMVKGNTMEGIVRDSQGKPLENVRVTFRVYERARPATRETRPVVSTNSWEVSVLTDADGKWSFNEAPADLSSVTVEVHHQDYMRQRLRGSSTAEMKEKTATIVMQNGAVVDGIVLGPDGKPVEGAEIFYDYQSSCSYPTPSRITDARGKFHFGDVNLNASDVDAPARNIMIVADGFAPALVDLNSEGGLKPEIRLSEGRPLRLKITDNNGKPVAGVELKANYWRGNATFHEGWRSDKAGLITWEHAPEDMIRYSISGENCAGRFIDLQPENGNLQTIAVGPRTVLSGRVIDAVTRKPISSFSITSGALYDEPNEDQSSWSRRPEAMSSADGSYRYEKLEKQPATYSHIQGKPPVTGMHRVRFEARGYAPVTSRPLWFDEGPVTMDVELKPEDPLRGTVSAPDGTPIKDAKLVIAGPGHTMIVMNGGFMDYCYDDALASATTNEKGEYELPPQDSDFPLAIVHPDKGYFITTYKALQMEPTVKLLPWGKLAVKGPPVADGKSLFDVSDPQLKTLDHYKKARFIFRSASPVVSPDGTVLFSHLTAGPKRVTTNQFGSHLERSVEVVSGKMVEVDMAVGKSHTLRGRIEVPADYPAGDLDSSFEIGTEYTPANSPNGMTYAYPMLQPGQTRSNPRTTYIRTSTWLKPDSEGRFVVENIPAGRYEIRGYYFRRGTDGNQDQNKVAFLPTQILVIEANKDVTDVGLLKVYSPKPIEGVVSAADGTPVSQAQIVVLGPDSPQLFVKGGVPFIKRQRRTASDSVGEYMLDSIQPANQIVITHPKWGYLQITGSDLRTQPKVRLRPWGTLAIMGRPNPLQQSRYRVRHPNYLNDEYRKSQKVWFLSGEPLVSANGIEQFDHLVAGPMKVILGQFGEQHGPIVEVEDSKTITADLTTGRHTLKGRIEMPPGAKGGQDMNRLMLLTATVPTLPSGINESNRAQWEQTPEGHTYFSNVVMTDVNPNASGSFEIPDLPAGKYKISGVLLHTADHGESTDAELQQKVLADLPEQVLAVDPAKPVTDVGLLQVKVREKKQPGKAAGAPVAVPVQSP